MRTIMFFVVCFFLCGLAAAQVPDEAIPKATLSDNVPTVVTPTDPNAVEGAPGPSNAPEPGPGAGAPAGPVCEGDRPVTRADLEGVMVAQWRQANNAANAAARQGRSDAPRLRQRANALALQVSALAARVEKLEQAGAGGPASDWARESVQSALDSGLLVGRREGATVDDDEWQAKADRQELAAGLLRVEARANERAVAAVATHNDSTEAHPFIQGLIGEEVRQRKSADTWLLAAAVVAAVMAIIALAGAARRFFLRDSNREPAASAPAPQSVGRRDIFIESARGDYSRETVVAADVAVAEALASAERVAAVMEIFAARAAARRGETDHPATPEEIVIRVVGGEPPATPREEAN